MEFVSITVTLLIGIVIGMAGAWTWANARAKQRNKSLSLSEKELKIIFAQQASRHIETSKESLDAIRLRLDQLTSNIQHYEASLQVGTEENHKVSYFGEHAGLFLRNNKTPQASNDKLSIGDTPPRDFANNGSGLFVGNVVQDKSANK